MGIGLVLVFLGSYMKNPIPRLSYYSLNLKDDITLREQSNDDDSANSYNIEIQQEAVKLSEMNPQSYILDSLSMSERVRQLTATTFTCPDETPIAPENTEARYNPRRRQCAKPTAIVLHWFSDWTSAPSFANWLVSEPLACQMVIDPKEAIVTQHFFQSSTEISACTGTAANAGTFNIEISGAYFGDVVDNPSHEHYSDLMKSTEKALKVACWAMNQYNIPHSHVIGHHQLSFDGKIDVGDKYLEYFRKRLEDECSV